MTHPQTAELRRYRRSVAGNSENKMREHNFESVFLHARRETIVPGLADPRPMGRGSHGCGPARKVRATRLGGPSTKGHPRTSRTLGLILLPKAPLSRGPTSPTAARAGQRSGAPKTHR